MQSIASYASWLSAGLDDNLIIFWLWLQVITCACAEHLNGLAKQAENAGWYAFDICVNGDIVRGPLH